MVPPFFVVRVLAISDPFPSCPFMRLSNPVVSPFLLCYPFRGVGGGGGAPVLPSLTQFAKTPCSSDEGGRDVCLFVCFLFLVAILYFLHFSSNDFCRGASLMWKV